MEGLDKLNSTVKVVNDLMKAIAEADDQKELNANYREMQIALRAISIHLSAVARDALVANNERAAELQAISTSRARQVVAEPVEVEVEPETEPEIEPEAKPKENKKAKKSGRK